MLSIEKTKELLNDENISDEEAERIRDACCDLAEIALEQYLDEKKKEKQTKTSQTSASF